MTKKYSKEELLDLYKIDKAYTWMKIAADDSLEDIKFKKEYIRQRRRLDRLIDLIPFKITDVVADFGCGNGIFADMVYNRVAKYDGIDFSEDFIELANKRKEKLQAENVKFYCEDIVAFCKNKNAHYDKVFSMDFSEHIYDEDFLEIFTAIMSSLKKGGSLYLHTPNADFILEILKKHGILKQVYGHIAIRNGEQYKKLFSDKGFNNVKINHIPHYVKFLSYLHVLSEIPFIGKFLKARLFIECIKE